MALLLRPRWHYTLFAFALGLILASAALELLKPPSHTTSTRSPEACAQSVHVILSPGAAPEMVAAVNAATESIDVLLFEFSSSELKSALTRGARRGVRIRVILDPKVDQNLGTALYLQNNSVRVRWSSSDYAYTHAKLAIIDGARVLLGSINWSRNALYNNREAEVFLYSPQAAAEFSRAFEVDWSKSRESSRSGVGET